MKTKRKYLSQVVITGGSTEKGIAALTVSIAILLIGGGILALAMNSTLTRSRSVGQAYKSSVLKNETEAGLEKGKSDLFSIAKTNGFSTATTGPELVGLIPGAASDIQPRFTIPGDNGMVTRVTYYPEAWGPCDPLTSFDLCYPKSYRVVSETTAQGQGKSYTAEALFTIDDTNWAEISFSILTNQAAPALLPPAPTEFDYSRYYFQNMTGRVHFGSIPAAANLHFAHSLNFFGPVTFEDPFADAASIPFTKDPGRNIVFEKGFTANYQISTFNADDFLDDIENNVDLDLDPILGGAEGCLLFKEDGFVDIYSCNLDPLVSGNARYQTFRGTYSTQTQGGTIYSDLSIHIKGFVCGAVTVASRTNVVIEGDVQYCDQLPHSEDVLGVLARNNIVIPPDVPLEAPVTMGGSVVVGCSGADLSSNGITNFWPSSDDRDYVANRNCDLDLDGHYFAMTGIWDIQNLNNPSFADGAGFPGLDRMIHTNHIDHSLNGDTPLPEYMYAADNTTRLVDPQFCHQDPAIAVCPSRFEIPRPMADEVRIFGGLVAANWSRLNRFWGLGLGQKFSGIDHVRIIADPRLGISPPPGYPFIGKKQIRTLWFRKGVVTEPIAVAVAPY